MASSSLSDEKKGFVGSGRIRFRGSGVRFRFEPKSRVTLESLIGVNNRTRVALFGNLSCAKSKKIDLDSIRRLRLHIGTHTYGVIEAVWFNTS